MQLQQKMRHFWQALKRVSWQEFRLLCVSWIYFTRIPLPTALTSKLSHEQESLEKSIRYFPLVGSIIGCLVGLVFVALFAATGSAPLAILVAIVASLLITGAFHEDGLADFFDAFGGATTKKRTLEIMKDSRIGTFGAAALIMALLLKFQSLSALPTNTVLFALIGAYAFSRFAAGSFVFTHTYVRANDEGHPKSIMKEQMSPKDFLAMAFLGMAPLLLLGNFLLLLAVPLLWIIRSIIGYYFTKRLGGYTGDCLGAIQQIIEISFYIVLIITLSIDIGVLSAAK